MRVAVVQSPRFPSAEAGLRWLLERLPRADLAVLPEYWIGVGPLDGEGYRRYVAGLAEAAGSLGGVLVGGAVAVDRGTVRNVCPVVDGGGLLGEGEKVFPSAATGERARVARGERLALFEAGGWTVGCLVCVDLMYPELARTLALAGAEVIANPASISADRAALWRAVALSRAFENSLYVASALGTGYSYPDGRPAAGGSLVAGPNGELWTLDGEEPGVLTVELDRGALQGARARRRYLEDAASLGRPAVVRLRKSL